MKNIFYYEILLECWEEVIEKARTITEQQKMIVLFFVFLLAVHCQVQFGFLPQCGTSNVGCLCRKAGATKPVCRLNEYGMSTELIYERSTLSYRVRSQSFNHNYCFYSNSTGKYQASQSGTCPDHGFQWSVVGFCLETGGSEPCCRNPKCSSCDNYARSCELVLGPTVPTPASRSTPTPKITTPSPTPSPTPQPTPMPVVSTTTTITSTLITTTRSTIDKTVKPTTTTTVTPISETMKSTPPQTSTDPFQIAATLSKSLTMTSITTENNDNSALVYALIAVGCVLLLTALAIFLFVLNKKRSKVKNKKKQSFFKIITKKYVCVQQNQETIGLSETKIPRKVFFFSDI